MCNHGYNVGGYLSHILSKIPKLEFNQWTKVGRFPLESLHNQVVPTANSPKCILYSVGGQDNRIYRKIKETYGLTHSYGILYQ